LDFSWTEEQAAFRKEVIRFSKQELNDSGRSAPRSAFKGCPFRKNTAVAELTR
jgi:hypothetical protein